MQILRLSGTVVFVFSLSFSIYAQTLEEQAGSAFATKDWSKASQLYSELIQQNPYLNFLYRIRYAISELNQNNYNNAIEGFKNFEALNHKWKNITLSQDWRVAWGLASAYRGKKMADSAAYWYDQYVALDVTQINGIRRDTALSSFIGTEKFEQITGLGLSSDKLSRNEKWEKDLAFLRKVLLRSHYNAFVKNTPEQWEIVYKSILQQIPRLDDKAISLEFTRLVALAGDGHTNMFPMTGDTTLGFKMMPVLINELKDGFFISLAEPSYAEYLGYQVTKIGSLNIEDAVVRCNAYLCGRENPSHVKFISPYALGSAELLERIGAIQGVTEIPLSLIKNGKQITLRFKSVPWRFTNLDLSETKWIKLGNQSAVPMYMTQLNENYWYQYNKEKNLVYFGFNKVQNKNNGQSLAAFSEALFKFIKENQVKYLVMDVRNNDGGSSDLYRPLLKDIITSDLNKKGQFFTIIGRKTFSAAMNFVTDVEYWTNAIFVGEPTGSSPVNIAENRVFHLPYSNLRVSLSDRLHQRGAGSSVDRRIWIAPHIVAESSSEDIKNGIDPAMEAILKSIQ